MRSPPAIALWMFVHRTAICVIGWLKRWTYCRNTKTVPSEIIDVPKQRLVAQHRETADDHHNCQCDIAERFECRVERAGEGCGAHIGVAVGGIDAAEIVDVFIRAVERLNFTHAGEAFLQGQR